MNNTLADLRHWFRSGIGQLVLMALVLGSVYLITQHTQHVLRLLPFALLLLCPLLHLFMHAGHDDHDDHGGHTSTVQGGASAAQQQHVHDKT